MKLAVVKASLPLSLALVMVLTSVTGCSTKKNEVETSAAYQVISLDPLTQCQNNNIYLGFNLKNASPETLQSSGTQLSGFKVKLLDSNSGITSQSDTLIIQNGDIKPGETGYVAAAIFIGPQSSKKSFDKVEISFKESVLFSDYLGVDTSICD